MTAALPILASVRMAGIAIVATACALASCGGGRDGGAAPATSAVPLASDLAASQTSASTIAAPDLPPPCTVDQLAFAQGASDEDGVLVVEITNTGGEWCEANLSGSVGVAAEMEPDVWIDPGAVALLRVEVDTTSCDAPAPVDTLGLDVNGEPVPVAIGALDVCALALAALYPA